MVGLLEEFDITVGIDDGHAPDTPGKRTPYIRALGRQIHENEFNKPVVNRIEQNLKRCGFKVVQLAPTDHDTPLNIRAATANREKCDIVVSIHFNAMGNTFSVSNASGFSVHIQPGLKANKNSEAYKLAEAIIKELAKGTAQVNRGIVGQNLAITRMTNMPAALVECGFMDDEREALLMLDVNFQNETADEVSVAICNYFGKKYIPAKGIVVRPIKPVLPASPVKDEQWFRVRKSANDSASQIGAYTKLSNAKFLADKNRSRGYKVYDAAFKLLYTPPAPSKKYSLPTRTVQMGSKGIHVGRLQTALNAANFRLRGKVDNIFGPDTLQALKRFQSVYTPDEVDGIAGPNTIAALDKLINR